MKELDFKHVLIISGILNMIFMFMLLGTKAEVKLQKELVKILEAEKNFYKNDSEKYFNLWLKNR